MSDKRVVLVVESQGAVRDSIARGLMGAGFGTTEALTLRALENRIGRINYTAIVVGPIQEGWRALGLDAISLIRGINPELPVYMFGPAELKDEAVRRGVSGYISSGNAWDVARSLVS